MPAKRHLSGDSSRGGSLFCVGLRGFESPLVRLGYFGILASKFGCLWFLSFIVGGKPMASPRRANSHVCLLWFLSVLGASPWLVCLLWFLSVLECWGQAYGTPLCMASPSQTNLHVWPPWFLSALECSRQVYCTLPMGFVWGCRAARFVSLLAKYVGEGGAYSNADRNQGRQRHKLASLGLAIGPASNNVKKPNRQASVLAFALCPLKFRKSVLTGNGSGY